MLQKFFEPRNVAVVGASRDSEKVGRIIFKNLTSGFKGRVYPVNPKADFIEEHKCYPSVEALPESVDLAVLAIPAERVPEALEQCGRRGIQNAIIVAGGFGEAGNTDLDKRLRETMAKYGIRVIGPNCLGIYDTYSNLNTFFLPSYRMDNPHIGPIAFIAQSGAVGGCGMDWAAAEGLGISKVISFGNRIDVDEVELLRFLKHDKHTKVFIMYLESVIRGPEFIEAAKEITPTKPIVALKGGRVPTGSGEVRSHTGSLAGDWEVYDAAFKKAGIIPAYSLEEVLDIAKAFSFQPPAQGNKIAIITSSGGFGIMATDALASTSLRLAPLAIATQDKLSKEFPPHCYVKNPIDLTGDADPKMYASALNAVLADEHVDGVVLIFLFQLPHLSSEIIPALEAVIKKSQKKPIVGVAVGSKFTEVHKSLLEDIGIPVYPTPERAVAVMKALVNYGKIHKFSKNGKK